MTGVNREQVKAMGDIMAKLNGIENRVPGQPIDNSHRDPNIAAMSEIMQRFRTATHNIREDAQNDEMLMEALQTERTEDGVRISEWRISIRHENGSGKFYDITNTNSDSKIASDLRLYEAALLLTRELNKGSSITSPKIRKILKLEEEFSKNLDDAIHHARLAKNTQGEKKVIAEARYSDARSKARSIKQQISEVR